VTSFQVDQSGGAGAGVAGESRVDLWANTAVTLTCLSPPPSAQFLWEVLYAPTGSAAVITNPNSQVASITPDVNTRSFRLHLRINAGGAGSDFYFILSCPKDSFGNPVNNGWRTPAWNEQEAEQNQGGNTLGYLPDYDRIILAVAALGGGSGPTTYTAATVTHTNSPYAIQPTDRTIKFDYSAWDGTAGSLVATLPPTPLIGEAHSFTNFKWAEVGGLPSPFPMINAAANFVQPYDPGTEVSGQTVHETAITDFGGSATVIWNGLEWLLF